MPAICCTRVVPKTSQLAMATFKIIYDRKHKVYDPKTQKVLNNEPALVQIRVTHNRKPRFFSTNVMVAPKDWDFRQDRVKGSHARYVDYNLKIKEALNSLEDQVLALERSGKSIDLNRLTLKVAELPATFDLFWRTQ